MAFYTGLVDHRGQPIEKRVLTEEVAAPTLTGVRTPITGYPGDGLNPQRIASIMKEADAGNPIRFLELAEAIEERYLHLVGVLGTRKRSVTQLEITVEDGSDDAQHKKHAEMVREWLKRDELSDELFDILDAIHKGYSFTEIIWDTSGSEWWPASLEYRDPRWFDFERHNLTVPQLIGEGGQRVALPGGKFIYNQMKAKSGVPLRGGLARATAWAWMFQAFTDRDAQIFIQTYGQPVRVGKYGPGTSETDRNSLFRAIANIAGDLAAMIPNSMSIDFIESKSLGATGDLHERRIDKIDQRVSKAILGQTATTDAIAGGHAVGREHRQVQEDIERSDAKQVGAAINRDLVKIWIDLQFGPQEVYPRIRIGRPEEKDIKQIVATATSLGLKVKAEEAYALAGISQPEDGDEVIDLGARAAAVKPKTGKPPAVAEPAPEEEEDEAEQGELSPEESAEAEQQAIDALASDAQARSAAATDLILDLLAGVVAQASDMEDVRTRVLAIAPQLPTKQLAYAMRQALVVARLSGRADLLDGVDG